MYFHPLIKTLVIISSLLATQNFSPDRCFGLIKKSYRTRFCSSIFDIAKAVQESSTDGTNIPAICGLPDGRDNIPVYDWQKFFTSFKKITNISTYHHFRFSKDHPGVVFCKENAKSVEEVQFKLCEKNCTGLPEIIKPKGLSFDRQMYLFREIRQFYKLGTENLVAPRPLPTQVE